MTLVFLSAYKTANISIYPTIGSDILETIFHCETITYLLRIILFLDIFYLKTFYLRTFNFHKNKKIVSCKSYLTTIICFYAKLRLLSNIIFFFFSNFIICIFMLNLMLYSAYFFLQGTMF